MNWDLLLAWLSERGSGSWSQLKAAHDWLTRDEDGPPSRAWTAARDLSALGHLEISWADGGSWSIAPPVLTLIPDTGRALLTGARTRELFDPIAEHGQLADAVDELNLFLDPWQQRGGPTTVTIGLDRETDAISLAERLGIPYTFAVAEQIARLLPPLENYQRTWQPGELIRGFEPERFDSATCLWNYVELTDEPGLYRCRTWNQQVFALRTALNHWYRVPPEPAAYEILRWDERRVLRYHRSKRELTVPGTASLPLLAARAATLCSGRIPRRITQSTSWTKVVYPNVTESVAERIARSLAQELVSV